ncbi:MAG: hypothetical protein HZA04_03140, partial [Nitrospinae bacterium]|nr:hypothetical protein [Nitrospinota bacterium]
PTHIAATTGCTSCHSKHYSGYNCEWCHTTAASGGYKKWSYSHDSVNNSACSACHGAGGIGD